MSTEDDLRGAIDELAGEASDADLLASLERRIARGNSTAPSYQRPRRRLVYAVAGGLVVAVVVVVAALGAGVVRDKTRSGTTPSIAVAALTGVTWRDPASGGTAVFTASTARLSDGCEAGLHRLRIGPHTLDVGDPIGQEATCGGTARPPAGPYRVAYDRQQAATAKFDRVLSGRSTWSRSGATLRITGAKTDFIVLRASGSAVTVAAENWSLHQALYRGVRVDRGVTVEGSLSAATLSISEDGRVRATDLCNNLSGTATITTTTIIFGPMNRTQRACRTGGNPRATAAIDAVLSGRITYSLLKDKLSLIGREGSILEYWLTS